MASLVTTADRRTLPRRTDEAGGEIESLAGRIDPKEMGARAQVAGESGDRPAAKKASKNTTGEQVKTRKRQSHKDILAATDEMAGLKYRPSTADTRQTFELILQSTHGLLGDQPQDVVRSAADLVLEVLKDDSKKDLDKKRELEMALGAPLTGEHFGELVNLSKKITDYEEDAQEQNEDADAAQGAIDEDTGVAVVFDESESEDQMDADQEDEDDAEFNEVSDEDQQGSGDEAADVPGDGLGDTVQIGSRAGASKSSSDQLTARDIDGFWLQRLISTSYPDPVIATEKTTEALGHLSSDISARDLENTLMELFDYEHFESVRILVANRDRIVWCTRLARADENERADVEVAMREKGVGWVLKELSSASAKMEVDGAAEPSAAEQEALSKKSNIAPGSLASQKAQMVDLEGMIFSQGARLMSNKRVKLPEGSTKRQFKTHEEIHIPVPPRVQHADKLLNVRDILPQWAGDCLHTNQLNRIQSKVYHTAWTQEEEEEQNMLICAPTGAGKVSAF